MVCRFTPANTADLNKFMTWALAQQTNGVNDVFVVTERQLINWMLNPVPSSQIGQTLAADNCGRKSLSGALDLLHPLPCPSHRHPLPPPSAQVRLAISKPNHRPRLPQGFRQITPTGIPAEYCRHTNLSC